MLKKILILIATSTIALLIACRSQIPVRIVSNVNHDFTEEKMVFCIKEAASKKGWVTKEIKQGLIEATYTRGSAIAAVDIEYDSSKYRITKNYQTTLDEADGTVDAVFNKWVRNLDRQIRIEINQVEFGSNK